VSRSASTLGRGAGARNSPPASDQGRSRTSTARPPSCESVSWSSPPWSATC
jgi:hypothetical protein